MPSSKTTRVVIVGGGAAGVFTGYLLAKCAKKHFDITILEKGDAIGGHTASFPVEEEGAKFNIDGGAQFFSETSEPTYCRLLKQEGLYRYLLQSNVGMNVWNVSRKKFTLRVPATYSELMSAVVNGGDTWRQFLLFNLAAIALYRQGGWDLRFGEWLDQLGLKAAFIRDVAKPLMYQFGLVSPSELDGLSARFVVFFYVRSFPWMLPDRPRALGAGLFSVFNSEIGLDGLLEQLVTKYGVKTQVQEEVTSVIRVADEYEVRTTKGTYRADEVVFAANPRRVLGMLPNDASNAALRQVLEGMPYTDVPVAVEKGTKAYMPDVEKQWEVSNVLVVEDAAGGRREATTYMLGVWFGPLRPQPAAKEYVKAWGSPQLTPGPTEQAKGQHHELMKGTPEFMRNRQILDTAHQGLNHMWFVGGYVLDYDSQESCLKSALRVATQLIEAHVRKLSSEGKTTLREYSSIEDPASCGVPPILAELAHAAASVDPESSYNLSLREQLHQLL